MKKKKKKKIIYKKMDDFNYEKEMENSMKGGKKIYKKYRK